MDPKAQIPDIKSEVNKLPGGDKKKLSGLLALLFGGGEGAGGLLGGLGGGMAGGGGLLATKAGLIALIVIGSAVAGGVGLAGYKIFGPGDSDKLGGNFMLFAPKPKGAEVDPNALAPVNKDGSSASLDYLAQAAAKDRAAEAAAAAAAAGAQEDAGGGAAAAPAQNAAPAPAGDAAVAEAAVAAFNAGAGAPGAVGWMGRGLAPGKKLGELASGGGGGSSASASVGKFGDGSAAAAAGKSGSLSAFSKGGPGAKASSNAGRGLAGRRAGSSARSQLGAVMRDQRGAGSSRAAGATYDGAGPAGGSAIAPDGRAIGLGGVGDGGYGAFPKSINPNSAVNTKQSEPPIPTPKNMVTPWEQAVLRAQMLIGLAMGLAFGASKIPRGPYTQIILYGISTAICAMGAYIGYLATQVMSGPYGQMLQGAVVAAGAAGVILTGIAVMAGAHSAQDANLKDGKPTLDVNGQKLKSDYNNPLNKDAGGVGLMSNPMVLLGGGLGLVAAIALQFVPKPPQIELKDGQSKPDVYRYRKADLPRYVV